MALWNVLQCVCKVCLRAPRRVHLNGVVRLPRAAGTAADYSSGFSCRAAPCVCGHWLPAGPCLQCPAYHASVQRAAIAQTVLGMIDASGAAVQCSSPEEAFSHSATVSRGGAAAVQCSSPEDVIQPLCHCQQGSSSSCAVQQPRRHVPATAPLAAGPHLQGLHGALVGVGCHQAQLRLAGPPLLPRKPAWPRGCHAAAVRRLSLLAPRLLQLTAHCQHGACTGAQVTVADIWLRQQQQLRLRGSFGYRSCLGCMLIARASFRTAHSCCQLAHNSTRS